MSVNNIVLEKLKKVLRLADRGATQGEIEAAMGRAKEIALRHNIELASINLDDEDEVKSAIQVEKDDSLKTRSKYKQPYHRWVFQVLREVFDVNVICRSYNHPGGKILTAIYIVGESTDVAITKEMFPFLEKMFPRILSKAVSASRLTYCAADTNGCYAGICSGIINTNRREKAKLSADDANRYALVLRKKEDIIQEKVKELFPNLRANKGRHVQCSSEGYDHGQQEGSKINLRQMGGSSTKKIS